MALLLRHVNTRPQRLAFTPPPLVLRVCSAQGPKTSNPTLVSGDRLWFYLAGGRPYAVLGVVLLSSCIGRKLQ